MNEPLEPNKARQGRRGPQVLIVLICALILAFVVWWAVGLYGSAIEPEDPVGGDPVDQSIDAEPGDAGVDVEAPAD